MLGIRKATGAIEESAGAIKDLSDTARGELLDWSAQLRADIQLATVLLIGTAAIAGVALLLSVMAMSRHD